MSTPAATYDLGKLHGGLRLPAEKLVSTSIEIQQVPVPDQIILPIQQHVGEPAQPIVGVGEYVLKGQLVAESYGSLSAPVHASSSGKVVAIEPWPVSRRLGDNAAWRSQKFLSVRRPGILRYDTVRCKIIQYVTGRSPKGTEPVSCAERP